MRLGDRNWGRWRWGADRDGLKVALGGSSRLCTTRAIIHFDTGCQTTRLCLRFRLKFSFRSRFGNRKQSPSLSRLDINVILLSLSIYVNVKNCRFFECLSHDTDNVEIFSMSNFDHNPNWKNSSELEFKNSRFHSVCMVEYLTENKPI